MHKFPRGRLIKLTLLMEMATENLVAACQAAVPVIRSLGDAMTSIDPKILKKLKGGGADNLPNP